MVDSSSMVSLLEQRMSNMADTASKDSIQALAKWIVFRRKHIKSFAKSMASAIENPSTTTTNNNNTAKNGNSSARQWLYLRILHEAIILDSGLSRWESLAEMREKLGDTLLEVAKSGCLDWQTTKKVEGFVKQWDTLNAFGGPTMINVLKKQLATPSPKTTMEPETDETTADEKTSSPDTSTTKKTASQVSPASPKRSKSPTRSPKRDREGAPKSTQIEADTVADTEDDALPVEAASPPPQESSSNKTESTTPVTPKVPKKEVTYDFEAKNIPYGKVDSKAFIDPCTAIATLQIARDLRNDTAVQLASLLKALPEDIKELCEEAEKETKESGQPYELPADKAREMSMRVSEKLLDMNLDEQLQNARTFLEIVGNQREARQRLIYLLIRSRCRFGANEAAEAFTNLDQVSKELKDRKNTLLDAMALEGLDFEETKEDKDKRKEQELPPLAWYKKESESVDEPDAKRAKVGDAE